MHPDWEGKTIEERRAFLRRYLAQARSTGPDQSTRKWQPISERVEIRWIGELTEA